MIFSLLFVSPNKISLFLSIPKFSKIFSAQKIYLVAKHKMKILINLLLNVKIKIELAFLKEMIIIRELNQLNLKIEDKYRR